MYRFFSIVALLLACSLTVSAQTNAYEIEIKLQGYSNDSIHLANYLMDKQYLRDTAVLNQKTGTYTFSGAEPMQPGIYLVVMPPENKFFQILINEEEKFFSLSADPDKPAETMKIKGSKDNELFYDYLKYLGEQRPLSEKYNSEKEKADEKKKADWQAKIDKINKEVADKQLEIINNHPKSLTAAVIKANRSTEMPEINGTDEKDTQFLKWQWTREHYFDNIDLGDPRLLRTPFLFQRVNYFNEKLTVQHPDSIAQSLFYILDRMQPAPDNFKYYLVHYLNEYAASKIVGFDAVYVALVERYYKTGKASWTEEEQLKKILDNAATLKPLLVGKVAPNIVTETQNGEKIALHDIDSPYTVLIFWDPECGHCKKSMPGLVDFYKKYNDKGVEVLAVCTRFMKETDNCWEFVKEKEIGLWLNTVDPYHRSKYKLIYDIRSTPQIYVLDKDKTILSKKIGSEQLGDLIDQIILREQEEMKQGK